MNIYRKLKNITTTLMIALATIPAAGEVIQVEPLFEYPVAPDEIVTLADKSNWLMQHFWDAMDFKGKDAVNQTALNDAFRVYTFPMQWADKAEVDKSVDAILQKIAKNPTLMVQFTKAAEDNLFGPHAQIWIDEVYMRFLETILKNKKITEARKKRYERQLRQLKSTVLGEPAPSFSFTSPSGDPRKFEPIGVLTVIEFGDPDCDDCRHAKLKMETDVEFSSLVDRGLVNVLFIVPDPQPGWQTQLVGYPSNWLVGGSDTAADILDLRSSPSFYVIGKDGRIAAKNVDVETAVKLAKKQAGS